MRDTEGEGAGEPAATEDLLYDVIRRLWPLHRTVVRAVERELADTGMTAGEHALLDALRTEGPRTVPQLARSMGLDRQPVQRWVNHAAELGLVVTAPNPAHRRSPLIRLTNEGTAAIRGVQQFEATELRQRLADLPAEDVRTTLHVLDRLGEEFRHLANGSRVQREETDSQGSRDSRRSEGSNSSNRNNGSPEGHDDRPAPPPLMHKGRSGE
ncbi:MarR family transcriptional regulator [Streptomyces sp. RPA4-5]|uniref:MarR family winged helix-turn-helix transcriptional regulator n=1 Tax=unclassified Streptomyces TaxID=2593676 RepID=UPI00143E71D7|nr:MULTISPECIES: MarR family transcriptional regulator [unclassified Streptomyces]QIY55315.1 MarR family transcriptional regulator [Streptomyces sp. RPA4-5]WJY38027.1 MarR family transcriptional regulator [Streptomyces sp. P9-2B-2]